MSAAAPSLVLSPEDWSYLHVTLEVEVEEFSRATSKMHILNLGVNQCIWGQRSLHQMKVHLCFPICLLQYKWRLYLSQILRKMHVLHLHLRTCATDSSFYYSLSKIDWWTAGTLLGQVITKRHHFHSSQVNYKGYSCMS